MATPENGWQSRFFKAIWSELEGLGYRGDLLQRSYRFDDWFSPENPQRITPAAAFGRTPLAYDSACFAVLLPQAKSGAELVAEYRALGSPLAFELTESKITLWAVGKDQASTTPQLHFPPDRIEQVFREHADDWSPRSILRAKNIGPTSQSQQLDLFIDTGLVPALEAEIMPKLDRILRDVLSSAEQAHIGSKGRKPDAKKLFRLVFRLLAAKVLHDREVGPFISLTSADSKAALEMVGTYYGESPSLLLQDAATRDAAAESLWRTIDFRNLSVEVLAYIYENTLVDATARRRLSTHSTPHSIARYIVRNLPLEDIPEDQRLIVEPCSGHGIFLVAALQRLRELLPPDIGAEDRHRYFVRMLRGFEVDAFAWEVSKLCLMLADFPNHNGWQLENEDVFTSSEFVQALRQARVVLCNPPFAKFTAAERMEYGSLRSVYKPAEILHRVLDHLRPGGVLGFVLPAKFIDGINYRGVRKALADRFENIQLVDLPEERVFQTSRHKAVLLLATGDRAGKEFTAVQFREVSDKGWSDFVSQSTFTRGDTLLKTTDEAERSLAVTQLHEIWQRLGGSPTLGTVAEVHRGIAWEDFDPDTCYSQEAKPNFRPGFGKANESDLQQFLPPKNIYLNVDPSNLRRGFDHPWESPKVFVNAGRISVGRWRHVAFLDDVGLLASQNFHGVWPTKATISIESIAAILNNPLAAAFVAAHEKGRHITGQTLKALPIPKIAEEEDWLIRQLVQEYMTRAYEAEGTGTDHASAIETLCEIDAKVLRMYALPGPLERELLEFFRKYTRPGPAAIVGTVDDCIADELSKMSKVPDEDEMEQRGTWDFLRKALAEGVR